jgi:ribonuclease E
MKDAGQLRGVIIMTTRMLIDARHREETRVAVVNGKQIEEFDFESAEHKQLKGNIYLAKVTRVEPSLQAAFVDYGGNRHGFLAFSEIHPDYYQIPKEDRDRLLAEEAAVAAEEAALREQEEAEDEQAGSLIRSEVRDEEDGDLIEVDSDDHIDTIDISEGEEPDLDTNDDDDEASADSDTDDATANEEEANDEKPGRRNRRRRGKGGKQNAAKASDEARAKRLNLRRRYKIQDVIHRRQVLLIQVVKEERGNKGAALTTYLSLAGRYCVLMPNTSHGGGISRKISSSSDRQRLKNIIADLNLPSTMGCIIRTAGLARTKPEIKRDFDYLARLWDEIRERTLRGSAPMLIHTDSDLIKRAIRDIYNKDIGDVIVEGGDGYKAAKDFMKLLMPSHAKRVQHYADPVPLFQRYGVEDQLNAMYHPVVQLKSGGYIVINPTEALVSIDINSGRSTKEHGIEQTALATNLEAAREIARQLRLRDMAGLVVIDFIDMENHSNGRKVERAMKEALKHDRARIQVGRISSFGLMEMSRQRLRTGVLEASTRQCPHCEGTGLVRTASSAALSALRLIEEEAAKGNGSLIQLIASHEAAIYVLNNKRAELAEIEERYGVSVEILPNNEAEGAKMTVSASGPRPERPLALAPIIDNDDGIDSDDVDSDLIEDGDDGATEMRDRPSDRHDRDGGEDRNGKRRRRRRGRRGGRNREREDSANSQSSETNPQTSEDGAEDIAEGRGDEEAVKAKAKGRDRSARSKAVPAAKDQPEPVPAETEATPVAAIEEAKPKRARRGKAKADAETTPPIADAAPVAAVNSETDPDAASDEKPKRRTRRKVAKAEPETVTDPVVTATPDEAAPKPKGRGRKKADTTANTATADGSAGEADAPSDGRRKGWWQRTFG